MFLAGGPGQGRLGALVSFDDGVVGIPGLDCFELSAGAMQGAAAAATTALAFPISELTRSRAIALQGALVFPWSLLLANLHPTPRDLPALALPTNMPVKYPS